MGALKAGQLRRGAGHQAEREETKDMVKSL